jgi:hypothetical protein
VGSGVGAGLGVRLRLDATTATVTPRPKRKRPFFMRGVYPGRAPGTIRRPVELGLMKSTKVENRGSRLKTPILGETPGKPN